MNSKQPSRYIKTRMGNDLKQKILVQNGIITEADARPTPTVADCYDVGSLTLLKISIAPPVVIL